jgi:hypothetical protein
MKILSLVILLLSTSICFAQTKDELIEKYMAVADIKGSYEANVELIKHHTKDIVLRDIIVKHYTWDWYREECKKDLNEWPRDRLVTIIQFFEDNSETLNFLSKTSRSGRVEFDIKQTDIWKDIENEVSNLPVAKSEADKWLGSSYEKKVAYLNGVMNATELTFHNYIQYTDFEYSQITNNPAIYKLCRESTQYPDDVDMLIEVLDLFYTEDSILYTREGSVFYTKEDRREEIKNIPVVRAVMIVRDALYDYDIEQQLNEAIALSQKQNSSTNSVE